MQSKLCECGNYVRSSRPYAVTITCRCGQSISVGEGDRDPPKIPTTSKPCTHRGTRIGQASCGCGAIYKCNLFNVLCGNKQPHDEWADVGGQFLGADFRVCSKCESFTSKEAT